MKMVRDNDILWRLEGEEERTLVGILVSTEHLTVARVDLYPGQHSPLQAHAGDESLYLLQGTLNVHVPENEGTKWFECKPGDGFYLPEGVKHQYHNVTDQPVRFLCGIAPGYLAPEKPA